MMTHSELYDKIVMGNGKKYRSNGYVLNDGEMTTVLFRRYGASAGELNVTVKQISKGRVEVRMKYRPFGYAPVLTVNMSQTFTAFPRELARIGENTTASRIIISVAEDLLD